MPRSRKKSSAKQSAIATTPIPLLDSLRSQTQLSNTEQNENDFNCDDSTVTKLDWECNQNDWSDKNMNPTSNTFPKTLRSIERKNERAKNNYFPENLPKSSTIEITNTSVNSNIDVSTLTIIISDLILGKCDQSAYKDFLSILQNYSVQSSRDDHLEETVYHLIQSAVSFIRSNKERFDPVQLEECYQQRYLLKKKSSQ